MGVVYRRINEHGLQGMWLICRGIGVQLSFGEKKERGRREEEREREREREERE